MIATLLVLLLTACHRRDLYVYGDEFYSVQLSVDWREYATHDPDGMTLWFWPEDDAPETTDTYRFTTADVRYFDLYLAGGRYRSVLIDYSPNEYSRQQFVDMESAYTACVRAALDTHQPEALSALYGEEAYALPLTDKQPSGLYTVSCQPENMGLDTLRNMTVSYGSYGNYIPYEQRDQYQQSISVNKYKMTPKTVVWNMRIRIFMKGINNLWQVQSSLAGMADGHYLARHENTDKLCLMTVDNWNIQRTDDAGNGYIEGTLTTFGLPPSFAGISNAIRVNLHLLLRDKSTILDYHLEVGEHVEIYEDQQLLVVDLSEQDFKNGGLGPIIVLPYVQPHDGAGFGADVDPWEDGPEADVPI